MKVKLYESEYLFCEILWARGPMGRKDLMKLCRAAMKWKGSVTRTAIRRLVKRGAVQVENGVVSMRIPKEEAEVTTKWCLFDLLHGGTMTANTAAAIRGDKMAAVEAAGVRQMMDRYMITSLVPGNRGIMIPPH